MPTFRAYQHLDQFAGRAPFSARLTRIAVENYLRKIYDKLGVSDRVELLSIG
jgi:DNA-directed RNA polymerase specialized sigma24 family protein